MIQLLIDTTALFIFASAAWYFLYRLLPTFGKWATLCLLHDVRDRLYDTRLKSLDVEKSLVFQDMIFSLTLLVHIVRDLPRRTAGAIVRSIVTTQPRSDEIADWRAMRYEVERTILIENAEDSKRLTVALDDFRKTRMILIFFEATSHPLKLFLVCVVISLFVFQGLYRRGRDNTDFSSIGETLDTIRKHEVADRKHLYA